MDDERLTKKEKRVIAKEEKRSKAQKQKLLSGFKKILVWVSILGIVFWFVFKTYQFFTAPDTELVSVPIELNENDWIRGDYEADVTLLIYEDFQCPSCALYAPIIEKLLEETPQDLRIVFRHYPLLQLHKNTLFSSRAAEAAGRQGKFWEIHDILYENQNDWADLEDPKEKFIEYAKQLELDENKFSEDYNSEDIMDKIETDIASGKTLNIDATPTFFLNGKKIQPKSFEQFKDLVDAEIRGYTLE